MSNITIIYHQDILKATLAALATVIGSEIYELLESECYDSEHMTMLLRSMKDCETQFLFLCLMYGEFGVNIPEPLIMLASITFYPEAGVEFTLPASLHTGSVYDLTTTLTHMDDLRKIQDLRAGGG